MTTMTEPKARKTLAEMAREAGNALGLRCPNPECRAAGEFSVCWVRHYPGRIMRRRVCRVCGRRTTTVERVQGENQ
ncbi:MAG: hypothetical protein A2V98_11535 [Planctomycetes bacterium RBG_16_64_12]|nr:MAG: hypothetical protein A2V98_11535 [Planctomycetes bacterium RBG_16_64_12]